MAISPQQGSPIIIPPDNTQSRWGAWEEEIREAGETGGDVFLQIWSLANSANLWVTNNSTPIRDGIEDALGEAREAVELAEDAWAEAVMAHDAAQDQAIILLAELQDQQMQQSVRMITSRDGLFAENSRIRIRSVGGLWRIEKIGNWVGEGAAHGERKISISTYEEGVIFPEDHDDLPWHDHSIPSFHAGSIHHLRVNEFTSFNTNFDSSRPIVVYYTVQHGEAKQLEVPISQQVIPAGEWPTLGVFENDTGHPLRVTVQFRVRWQNADRSIYYGQQVLLDDSNVVMYSRRNGLGPYTQFGSGLVSRTLQGAINLPAGSKLTFQANAGSGTDAQRRIQSGSIKAVWIAPEEEA